MQTNSTCPIDPDSSQTENEAEGRDRQRSRLATLIGRLLARHWLRQQNPEQQLNSAAAQPPLLTD